MKTPAGIGRLFAVVVIFLGLGSPGVAQKPTQAQSNPMRRACRSDYQTYCSAKDANLPNFPRGLRR